jgi:hypothetical protein
VDKAAVPKIGTRFGFSREQREAHRSRPWRFEKKKSTKPASFAMQEAADPGIVKPLKSGIASCRPYEFWFPVAQFAQLPPSRRERWRRFG